MVDVFQEFIENIKASFSEEGTSLLGDSVRCFHAGIFRPTDIMVYQSVRIRISRIA